MKKAKKMTPAQVAEKIAKFISKQEETLKRFPVGPLASAARLNLKKGNEALAKLQDTNESMRKVAAPQTQQPLPNIAGGYMKAKYGGFSVPKYEEGGAVVKESDGSDVASSKYLTPAIKSLIASLVETYGWSERNARIVAAGAYKESLGEVVKERTYNHNTSHATLKKTFSALKGKTDQEISDLIDKGRAEFYNTVYGTGSTAKKLGNTTEGDGSKFVGRGLIQLTGRANYKAFSLAFFGDERLLEDPDLIIKEEGLGAESAAWWFGEYGKGSFTDFSLDKDVTPKQEEALLKASYASIKSAGTGKTSAYREALVDSPLFEASFARMKEFVAETEGYSITPPIPMLTESTSDIPDGVATMGPGAGGGGYLGATMSSSNADLAGKPREGFLDPPLNQFSNLSDAEKGRIDKKVGVDILAKDFPYEDVKAWGSSTYGTVEGSSRSENTDNTFIGNPRGRSVGGSMTFRKDNAALQSSGGVGATVDETRVLLQSLVDSGLTVEQSYAYLSDTDNYQGMKKAIIPTTIYMGRSTLDMVKKTAVAAKEWVSDSDNRKGLLNSRIGLNIEEFPPVLASEADRNTSLKGTKRTRRAVSMAEDKKAHPNDYNIEPMPYMVPLSGGMVSSGEGGNKEIAIPNQPASSSKETESLLKYLEGKRSAPVKSKPREPIGPDTYNLDMGNPSALMAIPGLAALASGGVQGRALKTLSGPQEPLSALVPQFNYKSNVGQELQNVKDSSNAVMQNTNLQGQQQAAVNQSVMAQRLKASSGILQQDTAREQAARSRYDLMALQARMSNTALRNQYLQDSTNFKNKKEMLLAQTKQQPLNVIASSAQDYLQNVYKANLAAQLEGIGRPYTTGTE